jgi:Kef-type K+ transport system membrane component KefB
VVVPLGLGSAVFLGMAPVYNWSAALFVGAAMVATSVGITARVLSDLEMTQTKTAKVILGAAVIDDILGMIVLAIVGAVATGGAMQIVDIAIVVGEALLFVFVVLTFGPRLVERLAGEREFFEGKRIYDRRLDFLKPAKTRESVLVLAIAACLSLAAASSFFRLAPIIGAFLAGVAFADVERRYELHQHIQPLRVFLVPFFFVLMGAKVSLAAFAADPSLIVLAVGLTVLAAGTKYYPCRLAARSLGPTAAKAVGYGMMPRGEVGLIVAAIALDSGIIDGPLFSVVVFMTMGTSFLAPPLLRRAMAGGSHERVDRRLEIAKPHEWKPPE